MLQCVAVCCSVLQCVALCCSVLQSVAMCCSVLERSFRMSSRDVCILLDQEENASGAVGCIMLQCCSVV